MSKPEDAGPAEPNESRPALLLALRHTPEDVTRRCAEIYQSIASPRGTALDAMAWFDERDLRRLFEQYDALFFDGLLGRMLREGGGIPLTFRLSDRLTKAAGKTIRTVRHGRPGAKWERAQSFEIAVSTVLLRTSFGDGPPRAVSVGGLACKDWGEAVQRIMEHELLHLAEFLGWGASNCQADTFKTLSRNVFGHESSHHDLVTPRERAFHSHGLSVGDRATFEYDGVRRAGLVNRITKRATVLVEDPAGRRFSDGKRYVVYYIPIPSLRKEEAG